jgi:dihydrofolate synthase/folylpolyglutamate synthase
VNYEQSVAYMSGLLQFGIRLDRERFEELLHRVGDPQESLHCIHIAGTNGKGSTTTFIANVLHEAGYRTGSYLSPYVFDLRERILLNGAMIPKDDFARWVTVLQPHMESIAATDLGPTTEFELKTAVAFCWLAEMQVDFAVLEVGIGGRLDATNVIPPPIVAVITSIGLDHQHILGDTIGLIAREKAGIIKRGTRACITAVPPGEARDVIAARCVEEGVPLIAVGTQDALPADLRLALRGPFQRWNAATAATAVAVLRQAGVEVSDAALRRGLETATLPGRFQTIVPGDPALILDVAHNEDGGRVLAEAVRAELADRRIRFVVGMTRTHDPEPFLRQIASLAGDGRIVVTAPRFRPRPAEETAAAARAVRLKPLILEPASAAIARSWNDAGVGEAVVVTGSFYVVGETPPELRGDSVRGK